jgi:hypothetical protein
MIDTGKVKIGERYTPSLPEMDADALLLQSALLNIRPSLLKRLWDWLTGGNGHA